jgi:anaerobic selenocysteine-containing dehydrogenase
MNDIIINEKEKKGDVKLFELLQNPTRRKFLKLATLGGAAFAFSLAVKKVSDTIPQSTAHSLAKVSASSTRKSPLGEQMTFSETKDEFIVYDKEGKSLLIFEKQA